MEMLLGFFTNALVPLETIAIRLMSFLPPVIGGVVLLLIGLWVNRGLRLALGHVDRMMPIDDFARRTGVSTVLYRLGLGPSLMHLTGICVSIVVAVATLMAASDVLGLWVVPAFIRRMLMLAPQILASVLILAGGLYLGDLAGGIVCRAADANHIKSSLALQRITHGLVILFSGFMALETLGFDLSILTNSMTIIMASIGLGCAIAFGVAFGMAGKDMAEKLIRDLTPRGKTTPEPKMRVVR